MGIFFTGWAEEKIDVVSLMNPCLKKMEEINEKYKYIEKLPYEERMKEENKREVEIRKYLESLGSEKVFIMAIEASKKDREAAGWIFFYRGFCNMKTNPRIFLEYYLYHNKFKDIEPEDYRKDESEDLSIYIRERMNFEQEKGAVNEGIKFLNDPTNSSEEKKIIVQFLWDVWSGFFPRAEEIKDRGEIYEKMNQQSLSIIEMLNTVRKDTKLSEEVDKVLLNFQIHYSRNDLPVEFLQSPLISIVREKITQSMRKN